jgi:hypothetical protein
MTVTIRLLFGDIVDSCSTDKWKVMAGKLDWSKVDGLSNFVVTVEDNDGNRRRIANVYVGSGDHVAWTTEGRVERIIPAAAIIPTVRLFVSCCVKRNKLAAPPRLDIQPEVG